VRSLQDNLEFQDAEPSAKAQMIADMVESLERDVLNKNIEETNETTKTLTFDEKTGTFR
jgi:hypothetical protein